MALVNFKKGLLANLPATKTAGTFYVTTDERAMYLDVDASTRIRLGDFQEFATVDALTANANPNTSALYYVTDINCLAKWNGSEYIQINKDTGMTSVEVTGEGNAITAAVYDASGRKLTLTKGATYMTAADVDGKISAKVGTIEGTVKDYVDAKTSGIASDAALTELAGRVTTAEGKLDTLTGEESVTGSVRAIAKSYADSKDAAISAAQAAADAAQADVDALEGKVGTVPADKTVIDLISEAKTQADKGVTDAAAAKAAADAAQSDVDTLEGKVGTVPDGKTVVQMIADAQTAATYDDTELAGRVATIEGDYLKAADKTTLQGNIDTVSGKVTTLIGDDVDKSVRTIANEELAAQLIPAGAKESLDTLQEIAAWIQSHPDDASAMNAAIAKLEGILAGIGGDGEKATVVAYVTDAIAALNIGDYAKAADLTAAVARIGIAEGKITTLEGQVATINGDASTDGSIAKAAADTLASAKEHANGLNSAMDTRVKAIEDKNISNGANKVEASATNGNIKIDGVETVVYTHPAEHAISEVTGLQAALDAKAAQTSLDATNANVTANGEAITALQSGKADKATTLAGYGITDAYTKTETYTQDEVNALLTWGSF